MGRHGKASNRNCFANAPKNETWQNLVRKYTIGMKWLITVSNHGILERSYLYGFYKNQELFGQVNNHVSLICKPYST
jgi:hypothetical protein